MSLYYGGYGKHQDYVVAENEAQAVKKLQKKLNINYLQFTVKEVKVEGYKISCKKEGGKVAKEDTAGDGKGRQGHTEGTDIGEGSPGEA